MKKLITFTKALLSSVTIFAQNHVVESTSVKVADFDTKKHKGITATIQGDTLLTIVDNQGLNMVYELDYIGSGFDNGFEYSEYDSKDLDYYIVYIEGEYLKTITVLFLPLDARVIKIYEEKYLKY